MLSLYMTTVDLALPEMTAPASLIIPHLFHSHFQIYQVYAIYVTNKCKCWILVLMLFHDISCAISKLTCFLFLCSLCLLSVIDTAWFVKYFLAQNYCHTHLIDPGVMMYMYIHMYTNTVCCLYIPQFSSYNVDDPIKNFDGETCDVPHGMGITSRGQSRQECHS